jgi:hypothetical protein
MNADEIIDGLEEISSILPHSLIPNAAIDLIESLQAQLAESQRRAEKALGYIKKIFGCNECVHDDDETNYEACKSCNIYDKWRWRGDVEEGDAE